ncbi:ParB/RepB/Spo0J family partition protein [Deinococcus sp. SM5_A1]|uniref:ParB/RepB/Spo0J family partition protein n=1 Tax=Deinococcus sp. SM5_A1 TaxID=3379094 RepID=UPI00385CC937
MADFVSGVRGPTVITVRLDAVHVREGGNPRGRISGEGGFDEASLLALGQSMRDHGQLSPILVRRGNADGEWILVAGERRLRAARLLGLDTLLAMPRDDLDHGRTALIENLQRQALNAVDETFAILHQLALEASLDLQGLPSAMRAAARGEDPHGIAALMVSYGVTNLASWTRHRLNILRLTGEERHAVQEGALPWRTVVELTRLGERKQRESLLREAVKVQFSFSVMRARVNAVLRPVETPDGPAALWRSIKPQALDALRGKKRSQAERLLRELSGLLD